MQSEESNTRPSTAAASAAPLPPQAVAAFGSVLRAALGALTRTRWLFVAALVLQLLRLLEAFGVEPGAFDDELAEPGLVDEHGVPAVHELGIGGDVGEVEPAEVGADVEPVAAGVRRLGLAGGGEERGADREREPQ